MTNVEHYRERVRHYLEVAKEELEAVGPERSGDSSGYHPHATIVLPDMSEHDIPLGWPNDSYKRMIMFALSRMAGDLNLQAIILRMVVSGLRTDKVMKESGVSFPQGSITQQKIDYFTERLMDWVEQKAGERRIGLLSSEYREDFLLVFATGPGLPAIAESMTYEWVGDVLQLAPGPTGGLTDPEHQMIQNVIPPWWS